MTRPRFTSVEPFMGTGALDLGLEDSGFRNVSENSSAGKVPLRPFLKWTGGKSQLVHVLCRYAPPRFTRYIEAFAGGAALFFHLRPSVALLNDSNEELMITFEVVQRRVEELIGLLKTYPYSKRFYYRLRAQVPSVLDPVSRAARLIYLNRTCYNGLYRVNKENRFNVPFGDYKKPTICDEARLRAASRALRGTRLFCEDYKGFLLREAQAGDFIYLDPPYQPVSRYSDFTRYTREFFYEKDQEELASVTRELVGRGCRVLVSNSDTPLIKKLYEGFEILTVRARRNINKDPEGRGAIRELLIVCRR